MEQDSLRDSLSEVYKQGVPNPIYIDIFFINLLVGFICVNFLSGSKFGIMYSGRRLYQYNEDDFRIQY